MSQPSRDLVLLFAVSLLVRWLVVIPVQQPGYMDAAYSYDIALNLVHGNGFSEPFLWNYLDDPAGLPHPSHLYWMPLPTIMAWVGLKLFGESYRAAQAPFVFVSALLPLVSYWTALQVGGQRRHAWLAGLLTVFSGFYVLYWGHTDNFTPYALAGSLSLAAMWRAGRKRGAGAWALAAGVLAGLAHLSRADGPLLLVAIGLVWLQFLTPALRAGASVSNLQSPNNKEVGDWRLEIGHIGWLVLGYGLVMLPWFARNWAVVGRPLPTVGAQTVWLTTYDDLFSYGRDLSLQSYLAWGWGNILRSKLSALWLNAQSVLAVLCMVFLAPLAVVGWWRGRRHPLFQLAAWYAALLLIAMTFVFTFPGPRGGLFHSAGALLPFVFTAAAVGLDAAVEWAAARRRTWDARLAKVAFGVGLVGLAVLMSGFLTYQGVVVGTRWREQAAYRDLAGWLSAHNQRGEVVMVGDPPGYWYYSRGAAIVVPNEPLETVLAVADLYGARYLVLDVNRPRPLAAVYDGRQTHARLGPVETLANGLRIYPIRPPEVSR